MTTTTAPVVTITAPTFRRIIGDMLAAHDRALTGLWSDRIAAAADFVDGIRTALDMVDPEDVFAASDGGDMLPGEVATVVGDMADPSAHGVVAAVDIVRAAIRRGDPNPHDDDRCDAHGAGPVDGTRSPGFAGSIYVTRYACGCTDVDASGDVAER